MGEKVGAYGPKITLIVLQWKSTIKKYESGWNVYAVYLDWCFKSHKKLKQVSWPLKCRLKRSDTCSVYEIQLLSSELTNRFSYNAYILQKPENEHRYLFILGP